MRASLAALALLAAFILGGARDAHAIEHCEIVQVLPLVFGHYDATSSMPLDGTGTIGVRCTGVAPSDAIVIELGQGGAPSFMPRLLIYGPWALAYNIFLDAARTRVWGDGSGDTERVGPITPPDAGELSINVFGRLYERQSVAAGSYGDTLTITLHY